MDIVIPNSVVFILGAFISLRFVCVKKKDEYFAGLLKVVALSSLSTDDADDLLKQIAQILVIAQPDPD